MLWFINYINYNKIIINIVIYGGGGGEIPMYDIDSKHIITFLIFIS